MFCQMTLRDYFRLEEDDTDGTCIPCIWYTRLEMKMKNLLAFIILQDISIERKHNLVNELHNFIVI